MNRFAYETHCCWNPPNPIDNSENELHWMEFIEYYTNKCKNGSIFVVGPWYFHISTVVTSLRYYTLTHSMESGLKDFSTNSHCFHLKIRFHSNSLKKADVQTWSSTFTCKKKYSMATLCKYEQGRLFWALT